MVSRTEENTLINGRVNPIKPPTLVESFEDINGEWHLRPKDPLRRTDDQLHVRSVPEEDTNGESVNMVPSFNSPVRTGVEETEKYEPLPID